LCELNCRVPLACENSFDQGTPAPLRTALTAHTISTAHEMGWSDLDSGALLEAAEEKFDALITTDKNLRHQQELRGRGVAVLVLPMTSWLKLQRHLSQITAVVTELQPGDVCELIFC